LDQLLAGERPIIAEVKIRKDQNPFYALIQALTAAVELLTPAQRDRLRKRYPQSFPNNDDRTVDIYLIIYQWHQNGAVWKDLFHHTQETCHALSKITEVQKYITTIAILELLEPCNRTATFKRSIQHTPVRVTPVMECDRDRPLRVGYSRNLSDEMAASG